MSSTPFWNEIEGLPWREVQRVQEEKLRKQLDYLWARSPFYQRKLAQAGVKPGHIKTLSGLQNVPFTLKEELRDKST